MRGILWLKNLIRYRTSSRRIIRKLRFEPLERRDLLAIDLGDAPTPYPVTLAENGARHTTGGVLVLGSTVDSEANGTHSAAATSDGADEDGVTFGTMHVGQLGATATVVVTGATGNLDAWVDFNGDGAWGGPGEQIFASEEVGIGTNNLTFDVPSYAIAGTTYARFRLSTAGGLGTEGLAADGEVEDYQVTIANPTAASGVFGGQNIVNAAADGAKSVFAADVDGDGDIDMLSASFFDSKLAWYENDGSQNFTAHTISTAARGAYSVFAADVDGDGDTDVLSASFDDAKLAWYENDGSQNFTAHTISTAAVGAISVFAADVDGDGDTDVLSASYFDDKIAWYENDGSQNFTAHTISTNALGAYSVFAADVDGDGDTDMLSASRGDDKIAWYENDGSQNFAAHTITAAADRAVSVFAADVDGDGDLDALSASRADDKIAWYENLGSDFGDAPAPYPTTLAENGARHAVTGLTLGATRDVEANGTHSANANADGADDDGVTLGTMRVGQLGATATVVVAGGAGKLDAWIDFNGDGSWGGPGEQIFASQNVVAGTNNLTFDVPSYAIAGTTYARFRLSTAGALGVTGLAADGEVEDYQVTIANPTAASGVFGGQNIVTTAADSVRSVFAADVDGDGDMDMLSASTDDDKIAWYENDGSQNFTAHTISTAADNARSVFAADVDGDGDTDVLSASLFDDKIAWYENDGNQNFTTRTISTAANGAFSVFAADVDGDGDTDVLSASLFDDKIAWYENDGSQNFTAHTISTAAAGADSVFAADVDGDGDTDVLSASSADHKIAWYENNGSQIFTAHTISTAANGAASVFAADVDGDGDIDVLSASRLDDKIAWYENDGDQSFTAHTISTAANGAFSVFAADVDGDGDTDVLSASFLDDKIAWYENDGSQNFTAHTISTAANEAYSVFAADVDGDGDLDVLTANDDKIAWYENIGVDFGDAPTPYPTTIAENGARHAVTGPMLGATRNAETNGTHSAAANTDSGDDGVTLGTMRVGQLGATATVVVTGGAGKLDAWIDFNGDGSWGGPGEQIFASQSVVAGTNNLTFDVPSYAIAGTTYARFRLSTAGGLGTEGLAADGEVEDYQVTIANPAPTPGVFGAQNVITTAADGASSVVAADLDNDGDVDLLSASFFDDKIAWYENDGNQNFATHVISTTADGARNVFAADIDGDGDLDVLSASQSGNKIEWHENDGSQNFTTHQIGSTLQLPFSVLAADVDGDGDLDVLSGSQTDDKIVWYENDGNQNFTEHTVSTSVDLPRKVFAADVDRDGDLDLLSASSQDNKIAWYENDGNQSFTAHTISTAANDMSDVFATDLDGDGDIDVLGSSYLGGRVAWYENDGNQSFMTHTLGTAPRFIREIFAADMDGDGDIDVLVASSFEDKIVWYENDGSQNFSAHAITTLADVAHSVFPADIDGDGDLDVLSASVEDDKIAWYENLSGVTLSISQSTLAENGGQATVVARLSGPSAKDVTVNLAFTGTATNNTDYMASATSIVIPAGQTSGSITLTASDDALSEIVESIVVDIDTVTGAIEVTPQQVTAHIGSTLPAVVAANTPGSLVDLDRYSVSGSTLTINGTTGDDTIGLVRIDANSFYTYYNGELVVFSTATIQQVMVVGGAGRDTFSPTLASGVVDTATLGYRSLAVTSTGLSLQSDTEVNIPSGQSDDSVTVNDSLGDDLLYLLPSYAFMWNPAVGDYINWPVGFGTVTTNAAGGTDTLLFYGDAGAQTFAMSATQSSLTTGGRTLTANNFERQFAYGTAGDVANLTGTSGNDVFFRIDPYMILVAGSGWQEAIGFPEVNVTSGGGDDAAVFYDSSGDDTFTGSPTQSTFQTSVDLARVNNFRNVYAFASSGNDTATLSGSSGNDTFYGGQAVSTLSSVAPGYILQARGFDLVHANLSLGTTGNDLAFLDDAAGVDTLTAQNNFAELLYSAGNRVRVTAFDTVYARSTGGGVNQRTVTNPLLYSLIFTGSWAP